MALTLPDALMLEAEKAIRAYGSARLQFRQVQERLAEHFLLLGNDNKVGIAGEYWALKFYLSRGNLLEEIPRHSNNPSFDFIVTSETRETKRVSVKCITAENRKGLTSFVEASGDWHELCLVLMSDQLEPERFGIASKQLFQKRFSHCSGSQRANRRWLEEPWMTTFSASCLSK